MVRASPADLETVERAIEVLNATPAQVNLEARLIEVSSEDVKAVGFDWFLGGGPAASGNAPAAGSAAGMLTQPQAAQLLRALEQRNGVNVLATPRVTTLSGRQMQVRLEGLLTLDVLPTVEADGYSIRMTLLASLDGAGAPGSLSAGNRLSTSVAVWDGQTVVLGGWPRTGPAGASEGERKHVLLLITPTVIDPAGNRVHTADDRPYDPAAAPRQMPPKSASSNVLK